jgi:hypothetical protein
VIFLSSILPNNGVPYYFLENGYYTDILVEGEGREDEIICKNRENKKTNSNRIQIDLNPF